MSDARLKIVADALGTTPEYLRNETEIKNPSSDPQTEELMKLVNKDKQAKELF